MEIPKERIKLIFEAECGMIYLKIITATMKTKTQTIRISFLVILGVAILLANLALNRTQSIRQESTVAPSAQTSPTVSTPEVQDGAGSTDWIMFVAAVIVLIVIIPILLKRQAWGNGKQNRTTPPN